MVSALSRKEISKAIVRPVKINYGWIQETGSLAVSKDDFPYALQEFINSQANLPTFDEIKGKNVKPLDCVEVVR